MARGRKGRFAGKIAKTKARQVFRTNIKAPKRKVVKKFANHVGKTAFMAVVKKRTRRRRSYR